LSFSAGLNVPIVAGTDGMGLEIVRELELYVEAGFTPAEALQTATINPARLVKAGSASGSIKVGKSADMVLVDGDPSQRVGDARRSVWVVSAGRLMSCGPQSDSLDVLIDLRKSPSRY
jgi:imidazolonepropionase-like amidohydrolase